jgi:hypothetical protein
MIYMPETFQTMLPGLHFQGKVSFDTFVNKLLYSIVRGVLSSFTFLYSVFVQQNTLQKGRYFNMEPTSLL